MKQNINPYTLIGALVLILIFIGGIRYGQRVEKANKTVDFLASIPPTQPAPTQPPLQFAAYKNKTCGIEFLYPSFLSYETSSESARFVREKQAVIQISCEKILSPPPVSLEAPVATEEITLKNQAISGTLQNNQLIFTVKNPLNNRTLLIRIERDLYPLFEKSLEYIR